MSLDEAIYWLKKKADELRRELEIIEYLLRLLEKETRGPPEELLVTSDIGGTKILLSRSIQLDDVKEEYLMNRLNEIMGSSRYNVIKDKTGKFKGIVVYDDVDEKTVIEIKSILKTISEADKVRSSTL